MTGRLHGRTALITGAATGMGRATAERFAAEGARCVLFGLDDSRLDELARSLAAVAVCGDVRMPEDIERAVDATGGALDVVVNAAGIMVPDDPLSVTNESWSGTVAVNVTGAMNVCRAALPLMIAGGGGAIVNIASVAAFNPVAGMTSYAASKAALVSYTRSIAYAHGRDNIRANCVAPGWVRTPMSEMEMEIAARERSTSAEQEFERLAGTIALGRIGKPEEIANCCLFLASDEALFVTGAVLVADGGGRAPVQERAV